MPEVLQVLEVDEETSITRERLADGPSAGVEVVTLRVPGTAARVCPTRGMGLLDLTICKESIGWASPVGGPIHPSLVNLESRNKLGWLDGFSELVARCGLVFVGPPGADDEAGPIDGDITLHGRIANIPAKDVEVGHDDNGLYVRGTVDDAVLFGAQLRLRSETRLTPDGKIEIRDEVTNFGPGLAEYQLLYHINVGPPILDGGACVTVDQATAMCPRDPRAAEGIDSWSVCLPPTPGYAEQAYFFEPIANRQGKTVASLISSAGLGFDVEFDPAELPCLTLWKCTQPESAGYVVGLEPGTSYPNHKSYERSQNRVPRLESGASVVKTLTLSLRPNAQPADPNPAMTVFREPTAPMAVESDS